MATVCAALRDPAFDKGEVRSPTLLLGLQSDRLVERAKHLDALPGPRHARVQRRIMRKIREAYPGAGNRVSVMGRPPARHPATRIGGIECVGHVESPLRGLRIASGGVHERELWVRRR